MIKAQIFFDGLLIEGYNSKASPLSDYAAITAFTNNLHTECWPSTPENAANTCSATQQIEN